MIRLISFRRLDWFLDLHPPPHPAQAAARLAAAGFDTNRRRRFALSSTNLRKLSFLNGFQVLSVFNGLYRGHLVFQFFLVGLADLLFIIGNHAFRGVNHGFGNIAHFHELALLFIFLRMLFRFLGHALNFVFA
jgi:hypothetical protein